MRFHLFAIEDVGDGALVLVVEADSGGDGQRDTLVGRSIEHIKFNAGFYNGSGIIAAQFGNSPAGVEQPAVEEIGAMAAGFKRECSETQDAMVDGEVKESALIALHGMSVGGINKLVIKMS